MADQWISKKGGDFWDPRKDEGGNPRTPNGTASDSLIGWLLGYEENQGKDKNSTLYSILLPDESGQKEAWGTALLDEQMKKVPIGGYIKIQWLGLSQPKTKGGRPYHTWEVFHDPSKGTHASVSGNNAPPALATPANNGAADPANASNLPF